MTKEDIEDLGGNFDEDFDVSESLSEADTKTKSQKINPFNYNRSNGNGKLGHEEIYNLITSDEISWQAIIYDLIKSEQLDPLDIDFIMLSQSFLDKIRQLEEHNFFVSGKVLLAASMLLRMKADRVYDQLSYFDELLFGKEELANKELERIFISDDELPLILPKTPLARMRKVTIDELMSALNKAIEVETRRYRKHDLFLEAERDAAIVLPKIRINITKMIKELHQKIKDFFLSKTGQKLAFSELAGKTTEEKISTFIPLLHLDSREKITLEQEKAFDEIYIYLFKKNQEQDS